MQDRINCSVLARSILVRSMSAFGFNNSLSNPFRASKTLIDASVQEGA